MWYDSSDFAKKGWFKSNLTINHWTQFIKERPFEQSNSARSEVFIRAWKYSNALLGKVGLYLSGTQVLGERDGWDQLSSGKIETSP